MDGPLLATKLRLPAPRANAIRRPRLLERLRDPGRVVLVAAPAGFGKTSVLADWLSGLEGSVAWVALDDHDDDPARFWRYVLAAIGTAQPEAAEPALALLGAAPTEAVLATLVNTIEERGWRITLALDDYHLIANPEIHAGVEFLATRLPEGSRVVLSTRADPPLPLGRLRARGELTELRAADLRFGRRETAEYLTESMGLDLDDSHADLLADRTEGWIAALQLAALSLRGRDDPAEFLAGFAGDDRYVVDYLVEEVLHKQTDPVRRFLLRTSVLDRLSGELCDAVTGEPGSARMLDDLDRAHLFVVPLDDHREWYRYHHLFGEMLRARLRDEDPQAVAGLHRRAGDWFADHGDVDAAVEHLLAGGAFDAAAAAIKSAVPDMQRERREVRLASWFAALPADMVRADPELGLGYAGSLLSSGRTEGVDDLLAEAERSVGSGSADLKALRRGLTLYRAARALATGEIAAAVGHADEAVALARDGAPLDRGSAHGIRGLVLWAHGDLEEALAAWRISLRALEEAGHLSDVLGGSIAVVDILTALGRLNDAETVARRGLELATRTDPPLRGAVDMHVALAELLRVRDDLVGARAHLDAAEALGEYAGLPQSRHRRRMTAALVHHAEGDLDAALAVIGDAAVLYTPDFFPEVRPIAALRARLLLAAGRRADAIDEIRRRGVAESGELDYLGEYDRVTLTRVLLGGSDADIATAEGLVDRMLDVAREAGRGGVVLELLVLRALIDHRHDRRESALDALARAVAMAEPEGAVRVFAGDGGALAPLLAALARRDGDTPFLRRLRAAARTGDTPPASSMSSGLLDPLTERELEVLRLLASDLSGPEIARRLVVSLNTLRTHTKSVYAKLHATSRREALRAAAELGLLRSP